MAKETILSLTNNEQAYLCDALIKYINSKEDLFKVEGLNFHQIPQQTKESLIGLKKIVNRLAPYTFNKIDCYGV